ncbi:hypothetical protein D4T97_017315 [Siminovitchia acidinfaciens]|uniref:Uncharacterized protein n=1 Tax=Siminovitchia acidinfaciens TaxID=2321395 RepID=A0A429XV06_9BACI|nr:hypothetical protein [Siminovitchia acidinfaciens]RST72020.1 hypothetical protein D4T97_017315 [Siminovitchia acidinfaciens]
MSFKRMVKGSKGKNESADVYQRLEALESQSKRMNTLDVYIKKVLEMEKRLSQAIEKNDPRPGSKKIGNAELTAKDLRKNLVPFFEETVRAEFAPFQNALEDLFNRMSKVEKKMVALENWITEAVAPIERGIDEKRDDDHEMNGIDHHVIFQEIRVDTLFVDNYEQLNSIGSLGVKELSGQMNIGATFENSSNPSEEISNESKEKLKEKMKKLKKMKEKYGVNNDKDQHESSQNEESSEQAGERQQSDEK